MIEARVVTFDDIVEGRAEVPTEVYIAGPMRGLPDYNFPAFYAAEAELEKWGVGVIFNPARMDEDAGFDMKVTDPGDVDQYIDRDIGAIRSLNKQTGAIVMLPGWQNSTGALTEISLARWRGLRIILMPGAEKPAPGSVPAKTTIGMPTDAKERKALPVTTGVIDYFPDALLEVARVSRVGNDQHNPGQPLHWAKEKSTDEADALVRHLIERGKLDKDGTRHSAKVAWRALALLQREIDKEAGQ